MKIAYVTDSGTGRTIEELAKEGVISVPLQIIDGTTTFQDMETINRNRCLELIDEGHVLKTSQPAPGLIQEAFESLKSQGVDLVIAVPICNGLSGTISTMTAIAEDLDLKILCIDSYVTSEVQYYLIKRIKEMYETGASDMEVRLTVEKVINSCSTYIVPRNLDTLVRGGRLTPVAARFAKLLKIVPLLKIDKSTSGRIDSVANVRTYRKCIDKLVEEIKAAELDETYRLYIAHAGALAAAEDLYHRFKEDFPLADIQVIELVNPVAAHTGPGCIAIQYFKAI